MKVITLRAAVFCAVSAAVGFVSPHVAEAGTATIYQCRGPAGQPAAVDLLHLPAESSMLVRNFCSQSAFDWPLQLVRGTSRNLDVSTTAEVIVSGPAGTALSGGQIERQMFGYTYQTSGSPTTWGFGYRLSTADQTVIERCGSSWYESDGPQTCVATGSGAWQFPSETVSLPQTQSSMVRIGFGCYKAGGNCVQASNDEMLGIRRMAIRVDDLVAPVVSGAIGSLASDGLVQSRTLSLNASDAGLGLYRIVVTVDGRVTETQAFNPAATGCQDVDPSSSDPYEFDSASVCPTASTSRSFYLTSLPLSGQHEVRVDVEDASGNRTAALDRVTTFQLPAEGLLCPVEGCVTAAPVPNGANATAAAQMSLSSKKTVLVPYGGRPSISGRLLNSSGTPITGAQIELSQRQVRSTAWRPAGQVTTDAAGRFRYVAPSGTSRLVVAQYRPTVGSGAVSAQVQVTLRVRAGVTMTLRPATVSPGGLVRVTGRLRGSGIRAGTLVELQALDGREWRTFKTLPVRNGRFSYRYRFRHTASAAQFLWRIYARAQAGLPYAASTSRAAWVTVRG